MNPTTWTEDRMASLTKLWSEGYSCSQISAALGGITRNGVIGKIHRMGLARPHIKKIGRQKAPREHKPRLRIISSNSSTSHQRIIQSVESAEVVALRCAEVVPRNLTMAELERGDCRYPYGDGPFTFCGHAGTEDSSYCFAHRQLTKISARIAITHEEHLRRRREYTNAWRALRREQVSA